MSKFHPDDDGRDDYGPDCPICGGMMEWVDCWHCQGEGGFHDCGEDCCMCFDKEEITIDCEECNGEGGYLECMYVPHTYEQMAEYAKRTSGEQA